MLKPQVTASRELVSLDGLWNFTLGCGVEMEKQPPYYKQKLSPSLQAPVPASYNDIFVDKEIRDYVGWVFYQRQVRVPRGWSQERYFLRFDAATHHGRVYVDDHFFVEHVGGYTPFEADITHLVGAGEDFRLTVAVSNVLTWDTIPPGRLEISSDGKHKQAYNHDFFNYAGLARSVWLYCVPKVFTTDITCATDLGDASIGVVDFNISTSETLNVSNVRVSLLDEDDKIVQQSSKLHDRMTVEDVHVWRPGAAYLYHLHVELLSGGNIVMDTYAMPVGIRSIEVKGRQFFINREPFYFTGFGKHEDTLVRGKGHDNPQMINDFQLMKWTGANSFRTAHYPYAEEVLDYADRHGIVVIDETPAVGLHLNIIAGVFGLARKKTFGPEAINERTQSAHAQAIRELVNRDKNHPCVVMWLISNEPDSGDEGAREYFEPLTSLTRQLDPTRPISFANMALASAQSDLIADLFDVVCLNRYYGWYQHTGDLNIAEVALEKDLLSWQAKFGKPIVVAEYGADTLAGLHDVLATPWSEEFQSDFLDMYHRVFDRVPAVVGEHVWNFADFQTAPSTHRVDGNKKGVFTRDRRPKLGALVLKKRWTSIMEQKMRLGSANI